MKAIQYGKDAGLVQKGKIKAWVDVLIDEEDVISNWNKYIFFFKSGISSVVSLISFLS